MNQNLLPLVSIIITTYNREQFILLAINSALAQRYPNIEIIVIDDGSTDNTKEIIKNVSNINYYYQSNSERGAARNYGLNISTGEYIVIVDSDDVLAPDMVENLIAQFYHHPKNSIEKELGVVFGQVRYIKEDGTFIKNRYANSPPQGDVILDLLNAPLLQVTAMVKRECYITCGNFVEDRALSGSEDYELWFRIAKRYSFLYVNYHMLDYRIHDFQTSSFPAQNHQNLLELHRYLYSDLSLLPKIKHLKHITLANFFTYTAANFYLINSRWNSLRYLLYSMILNPQIIFQKKFIFLLAKIALGIKLVTGLKSLKIRKNKARHTFGDIFR